MEQKIDLRIIKTKKAIYSAFLELLETKPFESIKVSEICNQAMVNRSTFYTHFEDKYVLLDSLIKDTRNALVEKLKENTNITSSREYYLELIKILLDHVEEKKHFYTAIMTNNQNSIAMDMIYGVLEADITERIGEEMESDIPSEFVSYFYLGAIITVGLQWVKNRYRYSKEDIVSYLEKLIPEKI